MKTLIIGAAGLVMIAGCAEVTERTGLSKEDQICVGMTAADVIKTDATAQEKVLLVAEACRIDLSKLVNDAINTALVAADAAE